MLAPAGWLRIVNPFSNTIDHHHDALHLSKTAAHRESAWHGFGGNLDASLLSKATAPRESAWHGFSEDAYLGVMVAHRQSLHLAQSVAFVMLCSCRRPPGTGNPHGTGSAAIAMPYSCRRPPRARNPHGMASAVILPRRYEFARCLAPVEGRRASSIRIV
jgi:hypothetical protein